MIDMLTNHFDHQSLMISKMWWTVESKDEFDMQIKNKTNK